MSQVSGEDVARRYARVLRIRAYRALQQYGVDPAADEVDEVVQDVYCRLLADGGRRLAICRGKREGEVVSFLGRVVERVVVDQIRRRLAGKRCGWAAVSLSAESAARRAAVLRDPAGSPEQQFLAAEALRLLFGRCQAIAVHATGARDLRILRLAVCDGWSSREIARTLDAMTPSSVDSVIHRLRRRLLDGGIAMPRRAPVRQRVRS